MNITNICTFYKFILLKIAQRCYAALGNASKTYYLTEMITIADKYEETHGPGLQCPEVRARFALLNVDLRLVFIQCQLNS